MYVQDSAYVIILVMTLLPCLFPLPCMCQINAIMYPSMTQTMRCYNQLNTDTLQPLAKSVQTIITEASDIVLICNLIKGMPFLMWQIIIFKMTDGKALLKIIDDKSIQHNTLLKIKGEMRSLFQLEILKELLW